MLKPLLHTIVFGVIALYAGTAMAQGSDRFCLKHRSLEAIHVDCRAFMPPHATQKRILCADPDRAGALHTPTIANIDDWERVPAGTGGCGPVPNPAADVPRTRTEPTHRDSGR